MAGRGGGWRKAQMRIPPNGQIRLSQIVSTFGPGSLVDLLDSAVLIGGLDFWSWDQGKGCKVIHEPRLRDAIAERFRRADRRPLSLEEPFREPPAGDDKDPRTGVGILALEFPSWFVCQTCRALLQAGSPDLDKKGNGYRHPCTARGSECVPVRFVAMCKRGHLQDVPWRWFAHQGGRDCPAPSLTLHEGATGDISEIVVRCTCGAFQPLSRGLAPDALPQCEGKRPWLGSEGAEPDEEGRPSCDQRLSLRSRAASNAYFAQVVSALSIPEQGQELLDAVKSIWDAVQGIRTPEELAFLRRLVPKVQPTLGGFPDARILEAIESVRTGKVAARKSLRAAEYEVLISQEAEGPGDLPAPGEPFFARRHDPADGLPPKIGAVVLVSKLREVRAQVGFTRLEHASPDLEGEYDLGVSSAPLGLLEDWLPAVEVSGEGVLIALDERAVREWEIQEAVLRRAAELLAGHEAWVARTVRHRGAAAPVFPGARFYLLHSLAHLLITAISLECGYAASAIRERLYCAPHESEQPMAAILLSTGTSGAEGTLGGLVDEGRRHLRAHLRRAWDLGALCSNDPICAHHSPDGDLGERYLEGAACHGCLLIAESSCERSNRFLDRSLVVPTIGAGKGLAFFGERP